MALAEQQMEEALKQLIEKDREIQADLKATALQFIEAFSEMGKRFREQSERVEKEINRGVRLTKHRIHL